MGASPRRWKRVLASGVSGLFGMYLGGLLGVLVSIGFIDPASGDRGGIGSGLDVFAGLVFSVVITAGAALVVWLALPTLVAATMKWPRVGDAFAIQILAGVVLVSAVAFWFLAKVGDTTIGDFWIVLVLSHLVAGVVPAGSRWLVERSAA